VPPGDQHIPVLPIVYQDVRRLVVAAHRALGCRKPCGFLDLSGPRAAADQPDPAVTSA
jgi:hypothetical protein